MSKTRKSMYWGKHTKFQVRAAAGILNGVDVAALVEYNPELGRGPGVREQMSGPPLGISSCQCRQALLMLIHNPACPYRPKEILFRR